MSVSNWAAGIAIGDLFTADNFPDHPILRVTQKWTEDNVTHVVLTRVDNGLDFGRFTPNEIFKYCTRVEGKDDELRIRPGLGR